MGLDVLSLRVAFVITAVIMAALFYFISFRSTRSAYSRWWCLSLVLFLAGSSGFLLNGTDHQVWANPAGNTLTVAGCVLAWAAARSLRTTVRPLRLGAVPVLVTLAAAVAGDPAHDTWSGGAVFLLCMASLFAVIATDLWRLDRGDPEAAARWLAVLAALSSVFYVGRCGGFLAWGPHSDRFQTWFGSQPTILLNLVFLIAVCFTMSALSTEQSLRDLQRRATHDALTGLLNRDGFERLATAELARLRRSRSTGSLLLADLDQFKAINDTQGHAVGDEALRRFAEVCMRVGRSTDLIARYGGEEFAVLLPGADLDRAAEAAGRVADALRRTTLSVGIAMPTVSWGIVAIDPDRTLEELLLAADQALYDAKQQGRDRVVRR